MNNGDKMTWYKKADNVGADAYNTKVNVKMFGPTDYDVAADSISMQFEIDVEARSWGIDNISVTVVDNIQVPYTLTEYDDAGYEQDSQKVVDVDLSQVPKDIVRGSGSVTLGDLELWLDDQFNVDYKQSELTIYMY